MEDVAAGSFMLTLLDFKIPKDSAMYYSSTGLGKPPKEDGENFYYGKTIFFNVAKRF